MCAASHDAAALDAMDEAEDRAEELPEAGVVAGASVDHHGNGHLLFRVVHSTVVIGDDTAFPDAAQGRMRLVRAWIEDELQSVLKAADVSGCHPRDKPMKMMGSSVGDIVALQLSVYVTYSSSSACAD